MRANVKKDLQILEPFGTGNEEPTFVFTDINIESLKIIKEKHILLILKNSFDIISVLRNLKIIGIFTRLSLRDQKNQYLKLIPYAWKLIESRIKNKPVFKDLKLFLNKNFSAKLRKKYAN